MKKKLTKEDSQTMIKFREYYQRNEPQKWNEDIKS